MVRRWRESWPLALLALVCAAPVAEACPRLLRVQVENDTPMTVLSLQLGRVGQAGGSGAPDPESPAEAAVSLPPGGLAPGAAVVVGMGCRGVHELRAVFADGRVAVHALALRDQVVRLR